MSWFDLVAAVLLVIGGLGGHRVGLLAGLISWAGLAIGLLAGVRSVPFLLDRLHPTSQSLGLLLALGAMIACAILGQILGRAIGGAVRPVLRTPGLRSVDRALGAFAGMVGVVVLLWLMLPVLTSAPGVLTLQVTSSSTARLLDRELPSPPDTMSALRAALRTDAFPDVFAVLRPTPAVAAPPIDSGLSPSTSTEVARSVVKIEGQACDRVQDGSGFVIASDLIVTNAHVVAGERTTSVIRDDDRRFDAAVVLFDPDHDLAVLRVRSFDRPALRIGPDSPSDGSIGGVFGHPGGAPLRIAPFRVARTIDADGLDIYSSGRTTRRVLELGASLRPGDSGSPLVDPSGDVVGLAFAIARDRPDVAYALAPDELVSANAVAADAAAPVSTGRCLT